MRVVVAPDSFKGSLSAACAAGALVRGVLAADPGAEVRRCPLSDGGEGFLEVLHGGLGGELHAALVTGPLGEPVRAPWLLCPDGTAVIESATAIGLGLVPEGARAATRTTTYGVGELLREALDASARRVVLGLGGTATTDGGAGMAQALGVAFEPAGVPVRGSDLGSLRGVDARGLDPRLARIELILASDVDSVLSGDTGAARVFGPQKGATAEETAELDRGLAHLAALAGTPGTQAGDGAAGGLGYGLRVFAGATSRSGVTFVLDAVDFDGTVEGADLVLTGEGRLDAQSARGKVLRGVCDRCRPRGIPVVAIVGSLGEGASELYDAGLTAHFSLCDGPLSEAAARADAERLLERAARDVVRLFAAGRLRPP